jgi:Transposase DDE domain
LDIKIKDTDSKEFEDEYIIIAIDSTGIKVTNRGQWMRDKWNIKRKGYLKIHIAVNVKSKEILSIKVTDDEHVHDSKALPELVENIIKSDNVITIDKLLVLMAPMTVMIFLDI